MLLTGFVIGKFSFKQLVTDKKIWIATAFRLLIIPCVIVGLLMLIKASDLVLIMALFAYATPFGMNTIIIPAAYGGDPRPGAPEDGIPEGGALGQVGKGPVALRLGLPGEPVEEGRGLLPEAG